MGVGVWACAFQTNIPYSAYGWWASAVGRPPICPLPSNPIESN